MAQPLYIGGKWVETDTMIDVRFPYDDSVIDQVHLAHEEHIDMAIEAAQRGFEKTKHLHPYERADVLRYITQKISDQHEEFSQLLCLENGKTIKEARLEITRCVTTFQIAIGEAERIYGESYDLGVNSLSVGRHALVHTFPIGIVAGITPFNFPMNLAAHKIAPAIAAGCPIIIKPASATPLTMLKFAKIIQESGWPQEAFSVVPCEREVGQKLVEDDRISLLSFTGSPHVGWKMKSQAGKKKVVLELGGNAALIIDRDVSDWDWVISRTLMGAYYQAGQTCISVQRIFVHSEVAEEFQKRLLKAMESVIVGDPRDEKTYIGSIIDTKNADRISTWINEAIADGAICLSGSRRTENLLTPTLLTQVTADMKVTREEVFGPVATLTTFENLDDAIAQINESSFGLQVGIFTDSQKNLWKVFQEVEVGGVIHNDVPSFRADMMPYGGVKDSGLGREGVKYAIQDMLEDRLLVLRTN